MMKQDSSKVIMRYCHKISHKMFCELTKCHKIILLPKIVIRLSTVVCESGPRTMFIQLSWWLKESLRQFTQFTRWMQNSARWLPTFGPSRRTWAAGPPVGC